MTNPHLARLMLLRALTGLGVITAIGSTTSVKAEIAHESEISATQSDLRPNIFHDLVSLHKDRYTAFQGEPIIFMRSDVKKSAIPPKILRAAQRTYDCDQDLMETATVQFQLSPDSAIWHISCQRFAYQESAVFALVSLPNPARKYRFLTFKGPKGRKRTNDPGVLLNPEWDLETRTITSISLGRNSGDCGVLERYQVDQLGQFNLIEYREKRVCNGKVVPPESFPLIFKKK